MNNILHWNRLWLLIRKQAIENYKFYLIGGGTLAGLLFSVFLLTYHLSDGIAYDNQIILFIIGLFLGGTLFTSFTFSGLSNRPKGIAYLTLPASMLEKMICAFLYSNILFFVFYLIVFYAIDIPFVKMTVHYFPWKYNNIPQEIHNDSLVFGIGHKAFGYIVLTYFVIQTIFLLGSVYFERFVFIKTGLAIFGFCLLLYLINLLVAYGLMQGKVDAFPFAMLRVNYVSVNPPNFMKQILGVVFGYLLVPFLWVVCYIRLREKQM